ncbi:MAG: hypothetical protein HOP03_17400 [Lysobacter sp.]|nr:hypothetical protein [Lysobacter sp.]
MYTLRMTAFALLGCLSLSGCGNSTPSSSSDPAEEPTTFIGKAVKEATDGAKEELATKNLDLDVTGQPGAEITPAGDFLIDGKPVTLNTEQKALMLEYRGHLAKIADAGIGVGIEGADLAGKAMREAIRGVFTGETDQIDKKIEAEAEGVRQSAQELCTLLPAMKITQDKLAAMLPEFKPYATMDDGDVKDCMTDNDSHYDAGKEIGSQIGQAIKGDASGHGDTMNAAEEAEAASTKQ